MIFRERLQKIPQTTFVRCVGLHPIPQHCYFDESSELVMPSFGSNPMNSNGFYRMNYRIRLNQFEIPRTDQMK
jgi:hypothetical protein